MKFSLSLAPLLLNFLFADNALAQVQTANILEGCVDASLLVNDAIDLFPNKVSASYSDWWDITYHGTYKILTNLHSDVSYLLYQCGTVPPADVAAHHHVVSVPLQKMVITGTTQIPHIELLGRRASIEAYLGSQTYVSSNCLNQMINNDAIEHIPGDSTEYLGGLLTSHPESVVLGNPWSDKTANNTVIVSESKETSNKAIFEWHKFYAAFYNMELEANELFAEVEDRYDCTTENAAFVGRLFSFIGYPRPKVLWAYWSTWSEGWDVGRCDNYYCEFATLCSVDILDVPQGSAVMTDAEFEAHGKDADIWIFPSNDWAAIYGEKAEMLDRFKAVQRRKVYDYMGSGQNAWFEERMAEPDVVLEDFCAVVGRGLGTPLHIPIYFRDVFNDDVGFPPPCTGVDNVLETRATQCTRMATF